LQNDGRTVKGKKPHLTEKPRSHSGYRYAKGQRRYVESRSAYARQFLEMMQKPDVDQIEGLSPAISIEQKTTSKIRARPVGTVTEIYDYMRLLWARVGMPYSPATGLPIESHTLSQMVDRVLAQPSFRWFRFRPDQSALAASHSLHAASVNLPSWPSSKILLRIRPAR
jgi:hypothetical protein